MAGYGALIKHYGLEVPLPAKLSIISRKHKHYETGEWRVFTPRHAPEETLAGHLTFALKNEGVDLHVLKSLFCKIEKGEVEAMIRQEPTGQYSRRVWFLYEWLMDEGLDVPDLKTGNYVALLDPTLQYPGPSENSRRHRIRNNLPGVKDFCPLIWRTKELDAFIAEGFSQKTGAYLKSIHKDILLRASSFLLLKDSRASYAIEGESPPEDRAQRWGKAIGQAGQRPLSKEELLRLQQIVIGSSRFVKLGLRTQGGFVGEHDRISGAPVPEHISAKWEDLGQLASGLIEANYKLAHSDYDAVLAAALIAFGFVFIHPFADGNGRIHRYLIHHLLAIKNFIQQGVIFPVSSAILQNMDEYRQVLESYSHPRLGLIQWKPTLDHNVEILNETIDLYRYFDATKQAEFLYRCIKQTIEEIIPQEVDYLYRYDRFKAFADNQFEMPDKMVALLLRFLEQGGGKLSERVRKKEFHALSDVEVSVIEEAYADIFKDL